MEEQEFKSKYLVTGDWSQSIGKAVFHEYGLSCMHNLKICTNLQYIYSSVVSVQRIAVALVYKKIHLKKKQKKKRRF